MSRVERLVNLAAALSHTQTPLTFDAIRERVPGYADGEAGRRAFERDKEQLRDLGFDLRPERAGNETGYRLRPEDWAMGELHLEPDEAAALAVAASIARLEGDRADLAARAAGRISDVTAPGPVGEITARLGVADPVLVTATDAVARRRPLTFTYRPARGKPSPRHLEPYGLVLRNGRWYVVGRDVERDAVRAFRVDRIEGEMEAADPDGYVVPDGFRPDDAVPAEPWAMADERVTVRLALAADVAWWARHPLGHVAVVADDGATLVLEMEVGNTEPFLAYVASLLDSAEILSPPEIREALIEHVRAVAR